MYSMWPGCYSFRDEIKLFALWLKEQTEALGKKFKTGGMNKWLAAGIGAVALGLAGLGIASSTKKDA